MVLRPSDIHLMVQKLLVNLVEQPVAISEATDENDMLECRFKPNGNKGNKID
jgi:hypothetical protein